MSDPVVNLANVRAARRLERLKADFVRAFGRPQTMFAQQMALMVEAAAQATVRRFGCSHCQVIVSDAQGVILTDQCPRCGGPLGDDHGRHDR